MVIKYFLLISSFITILSASATSYQYVKFIKPASTIRKLSAVPKIDLARIQRSFDHFPTELIELPDDWPTEILFPQKPFFDYEIGKNSHITPDFSNGLDYPDPFLLTGHAAQRAVSYLYGKGELFFDHIPHVRSILKLQEMRKRNGLPPNRLGSLRPRSPFYRYPPHYYVG